MGLERKARRITQPQAQSLQVERITRVEPCVNGVTEMSHARSHGSIRRSVKPNRVERIRLNRQQPGWRGDSLDQPLCRGREALTEGRAWCQLYYDAEEGALICAEHEMARPGRDDASVPVAEQAGRR